MRFLFLSTLLFAASPPCDLALENPGGSKAGAPYTFTVMSNTVPVQVMVTAGGSEIWKGTTESLQQAVSVDVPESARGKNLEIVAENKDGCVVTWSETVQ
jgi:hypothetical protein